MTKPSEVLSKAADLIEPEGAWIKGMAAASRSGRAVGYAEAECFCVFGAVRVAAACDLGLPGFNLAWGFLERRIDAPIEWNDHPERTQAEVVKALRDAAELARSEDQ